MTLALEHHSTTADLLASKLALEQQYDNLESAFVKRNYPPLCQKVQHYVENYLDAQDYNASPIYHTSHCEASIDNMADIIYMQIKDDFPELFRAHESDSKARYTERSNDFYMLIYPLLLHELYKRRMKKYVYTLNAIPPSNGNPLL